MPFPPSQKTMEGLLKDNLERLTLVERRLAIGGGEGGGEPATIHPLGDVWQVSAGALPPDTLWCDGRDVSRVTYAELFAKIGTTYGRGDGSTTFNLPNLNGKELFVPNSAPLARWNISDVFMPLSPEEGTQAVPDSYEIRAMMTVSTGGNPTPRMRFSKGGADAFANAYVFARSWVNNSALNRASDTATMIYLTPEAAPRMTLQATVMHANIADYTEFEWDISGRNSATSPFLMTGVGAYQANEAFDGITLFCEGGPAMFGFMQVIPFGGSMVPSVIAIKDITSGVVGTGTTSGGGSTTTALPAGTVTSWAGAANAVPAGFLLCDGSAVLRAAYPALFGAIGTAFGAGDGSSTFNLPNGKGRVIVGQDTAQVEFDVVGEVGGAKSHSHLTGSGYDGGNVFSMVAGTALPDGRVLGSSVLNVDRIATAGGHSVAAARLAWVFDDSTHDPYMVQNWIISTGAGSTPAVPAVLPVSLWQEFSGIGTGLNAAPGSRAVWGGPVTGNLGATLSADKITITLPSAGTYRIRPHIGLAGTNQAAANANADVNGVSYSPSFSYGAPGPAGAWSYETEFTINATGPTTLLFAVNAANTYGWSHLRIEKYEPFFQQNALAVQQGSTALRDATYGVPATDAEKASLANRVITWFNTDKGYFEIYYAVSGTVGLAAKGLFPTGYPAGWYPAAGSNIWATCMMLNAQSVASGEVRINLNTGELVGGITTGNNVIVIPVGGIWETNAHLYIWGTSGTYRGVQAFNVSDGTVYCSGTTSANWDIAATPRRARIPAGAQVGLRTSGDAANTIQGQSWPAIEIKYMGPPLVTG